MTPSGNAAYRLSCAMRASGIDSCVLNLLCKVEKDHVYNYRRNIIGLLSRAIDKFVCNYRKRGKTKDSYFYNSLPVFGTDIAKHPLVSGADVIYLHWVAKFLSIDNVEDIAKLGKPVVIFMHDMWAFTGGCHHSLGCLGYTSKCNDCPMFSRSNRSVEAHLRSKKELYAQYPNLCFVSPSKWMAGLAVQSCALKNKKMFTIPNVVDETVFRPLGKEFAREALGLPKDKIIITFGCQAGQDNPFKGWSYLEKAINKVRRDNILIVIYGSGYNKETVDKVRHPVHFLGRISDEHQLSLICNAADLFVTPSLCESYSLVSLENILCGTPVVGFDTTAIPELVKTGETGYLARFKDEDDLAKGIETLIDNRPEMTFRNHYSSKAIVDSHINMIRQMKNM